MLVRRSNITVVDTEAAWEGDSSDNDTELIMSYSLHHQRQTYEDSRADVHRCTSGVCPACSASHTNPTFIQTARIDPLTIRVLPKRWWDTDESEKRTAAGKRSVLGSFVHSTIDDLCQCDDDNSPRFVASTITFLKRRDTKTGSSASFEKSYSTLENDSIVGAELCLHKLRILSIQEDESLHYDEPCL